MEEKHKKENRTKHIPFLKAEKNEKKSVSSLEMAYLLHSPLHTNPSPFLFASLKLYY